MTPNIDRSCLFHLPACICTILTSTKSQIIRRSSIRQLYYNYKLLCITK